MILFVQGAILIINLLLIINPLAAMSHIKVVIWCLLAVLFN